MADARGIQDSQRAIAFGTPFLGYNERSAGQRSVPSGCRVKAEPGKPPVNEGWSGSLEQDGPLSIGAMKKEEQTGGRSITPDLENDNVMRTKRASGFRNVLFQRSTWAISPVSFPTAVCCSEGDHRRVGRPEGGSAMPLAIS